MFVISWVDVVYSRKLPIPRVLVVARPTVGRELATRLGSDRFEIHRSPDLESAVDVIRRLRPQLVIVALDSRSLTSAQIVDPVRAHIASLPVLILTQEQQRLTDRGVVELPTDVGGDELHYAVSALLGGHGRLDSGSIPNLIL